MRVLKFLSLFVLAVILGTGVSQAQTLEAVLSSLQERQEKLKKKEEVRGSLSEQEPYPVDLIAWNGASAYPGEGELNAKPMGERVALLNQAVKEYERIAPSYLQIKTLHDVERLDTLQAITIAPDQRLPRVTVSNFHAVLQELALRVDAMRVLPWVAKYHTTRPQVLIFNTELTSFEFTIWADTHYYDSIWVSPYVLDAVGDSRRECYDFTGTLSASGNAFMYADESIPGSEAGGEVWGANLVSDVSSSLGANDPMQGKMVAFLKHEYSIASGVSVRGAEVEKGKGWKKMGDVSGGLHIEPGFSFQGSWHLAYNGLYGLETSGLEWGDQGLSPAWLFRRYEFDNNGVPIRDINTYNCGNPYNGKWVVLLEPQFQKGLAASTQQQALSTLRAIRHSGAGCAIVVDPLHASNSVSLEIDGLGKLAVEEPKWLRTDQDSTFLLDTEIDFNNRERFAWTDSSPSNLTAPINRGAWTAPSFRAPHFASGGQQVDVRYDSAHNADMLTWDGTPANAHSGWPSYRTYYYYWQAPRLRQVIGKDVVVDVNYDGAPSDYRTLVRVYRIPVGHSLTNDADGYVNVSGLSLWKQYRFKSPALNGAGFAEDPLKLDIEEVGGRTFKVTWSVSPTPDIDPNNPTVFEPPVITGWNVELKDGTDTVQSYAVTQGKNAQDRFEVTCNRTLNGTSLPTQTWTMPGPYFSERFQQYKETSGSDSRIWDFTYTEANEVNNYVNPASYGDRFPKTVSFSGTKDQPYYMEWNDDGTLKKETSGSWKKFYDYLGGKCTIQSTYDDQPYQQEEIEWKNGATKIRTTSTPDGGTSLANGAWSEVTLNSGASGVPLSPTLVENSDGTSMTVSVTPTQVKTKELPRGIERIVDMNERGYRTSEVVNFHTGGNGVQVGGSTYSDFTAWGAPTKATAFGSGLTTSWGYAPDQENLGNMTDGLGLARSWTYDALKRVSAFSWNGKAGTVTPNGLGGSVGIAGLGISSSITRDAFGRATSGTSTNGQTVAWTNSENVGQSTLSLVNGSTSASFAQVIDKTNGAMVSAAGNVLPSQVNGSGLVVDGGLFKQTNTTASGGLAQTVWTDAWGRVRKTQSPGNKTTNITYSSPSQPVHRQVAKGNGTTSISEYNTATGVSRQGTDGNGDDLLGGSDRYVESVTTANGVITTTTSATDAGGFREVSSTIWTPANGVTVTNYNSNEEAVASIPNFANKTVTVTSSKGWTNTKTFNKFGQLDFAQLSGTGVTPASVDPVHDDAGRLTGNQLTIGGSTSKVELNAAGLLTKVELPGLGDVLGGHSLANGSESLTIAGRTTTASFNGLTQSESGVGEWPRSKVTELLNGGFKVTTTPGTGAATVENFNGDFEKSAHSYVTGAGISLTRGVGGMVTKRNEGAGDVSYDYSTDGNFDLTDINYPAVGGISAGAVHVVRGDAGEAKSITDASGTRTIGYDKGRATTEKYTAGPLQGYEIVRSFPDGRQSAVTIKMNGQVVGSTAFGYNGGSDELLNVQANGGTWTYGREATSRAVNNLGNGTLSQNWGRDGQGRAVWSSSNVPGALEVSSTTFDSLGRRDVVSTNAGNWDYDYQGDGQLASAKLSGEGKFSYSFNGIGQRTRYRVRGSELMDAVANSLNQPYTRSRVQSATLLMSANSQSSVKINGQSVTPFLGSAWKELTTTDPAGGWVPWTVEARLSGGGVNGSDRVAEKHGAVWLPPAQETLTYTAAGQRATDCHWAYQWDGLGRLAKMQTHDYLTAPEGLVVEFAYDGEGRRFRKHVNRYEYGGVTESKETLYIWDGWDLMYERCTRNAGALEYERSYSWGLDVSGTRGGAGGAGGLVSMTEKRGANTMTYVPLYDTAGNVTGLADGDGQLVASYQWGPFGEAMMAAGQQAERNPFRWATKYFDAETGMYYFGHRYYDPSTGSWLSREPLGEGESLNLYAYCGNDPVNKVDVLGLAAADVTQGIQSAKAAQLALYLALANFGSGDESTLLDDYNKIEGLFNNYTNARLGAESEMSKFLAEGWFLSFRGVDESLSSEISRMPVSILGMSPSRDQSRQWLALLGQQSAAFSDQGDTLETAYRISYGTEIASNGVLLVTGVGGLGAATGKIVATQGVKAGAVFLAKQAAISGAVMGVGYGAQEGMIAAGMKPEHAQMAMKGAELFFAVRSLKLARMVPAKTPLTPNPYAGVQEASAYLRAQGVPRNVRKQVLESFDVRTIGVRQAGASEYGLRYFDNVDAVAKGRYLFETFPASRASLALDAQWNKMTNFTQWQVRPGATLFEGVASPQGIGLPGGQIQKFVPNLNDLLSP